MTVGPRFGDPPVGDGEGVGSAVDDGEGPQKPNADNADGPIDRFLSLFLVRPVDDGTFDDQSNNRDSRLSV